MEDPILDSTSIALLLEQHDELRRIADECDALADRLEEGEPVGAELVSRLGWLRLAFDAHNRYEERLLRPMIAAELGQARVVETLFAAHVEDHRALRRSLEEEQADQVRGVVALLRRHIAEEEQYFAVRELRGPGDGSCAGAVG